MTVFDLPAVKKRITELTEQTTQEGFWEREDAQGITRELAQSQDRYRIWEEIEGELEEVETLAELIAQSADADLQEEFYERAEKLGREIGHAQTIVLLDEEYDDTTAILSVHAGSGGLDSQDWAEMLYRMYLRWAENRGYKVRLLDELPDQEAGIKSVTIEIKGPYAYGYLKGESGVHRLVRISPFDSAKRRHTSFASVEVVPLLPETAEIEIRPEDIKLDTFRASGAGGQYVNRTDSAVRLTHTPSGIVVSCQVERSQHMNRATAMQMLRSKLFERQLRQRREQLAALKGEKLSISWGSQIRSYTLQPFQMAKDHRSGLEVGNVQGVLDGDLDDLLTAYLRFLKTGRTSGQGGGEEDA